MIKICFEFQYIFKNKLTIIIITIIVVHIEYAVLVLLRNVEPTTSVQNRVVEIIMSVLYQVIFCIIFLFHSFERINNLLLIMNDFFQRLFRDFGLLACTYIIVRLSLK